MKFDRNLALANFGSERAKESNRAFMSHDNSP